ncbi:MAG: hypothetical protein IJ272_10390 [Clostridia bacterium]|nr:hypothetical protein [Clostridia bacterium]
MVAEYLVLGAGAALARDAVTIEYLKSKQLELSDAEKEQFARDSYRRFVHFTSKESAEQIMQSGFLIPTKGMLDNHFTKSIDGRGKKKDSDMVYMFDSATFSVDDYIRNLPKSRSPFNGCYEYYAVSMRPDEHEINNFKRRAQDGAITYEGRLDIDGTDTKLVKYVLGLDEQGKYKLDEVPMDFEYKPSQELRDKLAKDKMGMLRYTLTTYMSEVKKSKASLKRFKAQREEYKEQIRKKKDFAKANRQFIEEEKDKNYVFEKDGRTIVVKNIEYEQVGGKKLQKLAIIENSADTKNKKLGEATKFCYMDEFNIEDMEPHVATEYFFGNLDRIKGKQSTVPEYIGLPIENLETGEVTNEYDTTFDTTFKKYMDERQTRQDRVQPKYDEIQKSKKWTQKIKAMFTKVFGKKKDVKLLSESVSQPSYEAEDRDALAKLGNSSVEAMHKGDKEAEMFSILQDNTYPPQSQEIIAYDQSYKEVQGIEGQDLTIEEQ